MYFDFANLPVRDRYKLAVSTIVPRPIAWMVTLDELDRVNAAPFSFFNIFSDDPMVVGIGIGPRPEGSAKDTVANVRARGEFVICLVSEEVLQGMNVTAADFEPGTGELAQAGLTPLPSEKVAPPRIAESPVALECRTFQLIPIGRHTLVLGEVVGMHIRDELMLDPARHYVDTPGLRLVGRMHGRGWYARTTDLVDVPRITAAEWLAGKEEE
jgi:flavin reductase (DIM6/NTAB) family NADH-FMN oxidoreductase RutF